MTVPRAPVDGPPAPPHRGLTEAVTELLGDEHWRFFARHGYLPLGPLCEPAEAGALRRRALETGVVALRDHFSELPLRPFHDLLHHPLMHELCAHVYGPKAPVMVFRADVTPQNVDAGAWHQGAAALAELDRDELVHVVVGIGEADATVDVVEGSHRLGLRPAVDGAEARQLRLGIRAGHGLLLHRWLIQRIRGSRVELWFVDGRTRSIVSGYRELPMLAGTVERTPYPCVRVLEREIAALREIVDRCPR